MYVYQPGEKAAIDEARANGTFEDITHKRVNTEKVLTLEDAAKLSENERDGKKKYFDHRTGQIMHVPIFNGLAINKNRSNCIKCNGILESGGRCLRRTCH